MKFSQEQVELAKLAYPLFSNAELSEHIGCSICWLEKLALRHDIKKAEYCFAPGQSGYPLDLSGMSFGILRVIEKIGKKEKNNIMWSCQCQCGKKIRCRASVLRRGLKKECGYCPNKPKENRRKNGEMGSWIWSKIKSHANERGIEVSIDCDYIVSLFNKQDGKCALTGMKIDFPRIVRDRKSGTASLDRIDSSLPYCKGNLQWIHKDINIMKHKFSQRYFIQLCDMVITHNER